MDQEAELEVETKEIPLEESLTPDNIANLITERIKPGSRGLLSEETVTEEVTEETTEEEVITEDAEEDGEVISELAPAGGQQANAGTTVGMKDANGNPIDVKTALTEVSNTCQHILQHADKTIKACEAGDVGLARMHFTQLLGASGIGYERLDELCTMYGMPPLATK